MVNRMIIKDKGWQNLNPVGFGCGGCPPPHMSGSRIQKYWRICYVFSGKGVYERNGVSYSVSAGSIFVIPPYTSVFAEADAANPWDCAWVDFTSQRELPVKLPDVMECAAAQPIFQAMKMCEQQDGGCSAFLCAKLGELFYLLLNNDVPITSDHVEWALDYIHSEYMHGITVEQVAQRLNLDRSYFSTLFKKRMGISPGKYIMAYRMRMAASMLLKSGNSVSVTANSIGYSDIYIFSKMFKRYYGLSPREYVKRNKGQP